jgi:dihydroorotate dehydrogenase
MSGLPFYNPNFTYEENYLFGPFGLFANNNVMPQPTPHPTKRFLGLPIHETIGIPAGPLLNSAYCDAAFRYSFDVVVYKTVRSSQLMSLPFPNILEVLPNGVLKPGDKVIAREIPENAPNPPANITNSFGVPSKSPDVWQEDMKKAVGYQREGQILIGSFQGSGEGTEQIDDYVRVAHMVAETGAPVLEANLSCPNEGRNSLLCFDADKVEAIVKGIRDEINDRPLLVKLAYFDDEKKLTNVIRAIGHRVDGICVINTLPAHVVTADGKSALPGRETAGVCGDAIRWAGLAMTEKLKHMREIHKMNFAIIAGGGVSKPEHDTDYRNAGADCVMSATGAMWNPMLAQEIKAQYRY